ncbi:hypothetical protein [Curtobacterium sp. Arg-1]|nr:hypothetical protein [Curtobacterium sp. Arg-1]UXZ57057.1 hypothetical protein MXD64_13765 [Curtobacterium sp. Arg-1]
MRRAVPLTAHGVACACPVCWLAEDLDDDALGKAIARAAEHDEPTDCD